MATSLELLALPHAQAMPAIVQELLKPGVSVADLVIQTPVAGTGLDMSADIFISGSAYNNPNWPYFGNVTLKYTRLDLADTLGFLNLGFVMPTNFSSTELAGKISQALGIHFDSEDIFIEGYTLTEKVSEVVLKAGGNSKRWKGSLPVQVIWDNPVIVEDPDYTITVDYLDGHQYPSPLTSDTLPGHLYPEMLNTLVLPGHVYQGLISNDQLDGLEPVPVNWVTSLNGLDNIDPLNAIYLNGHLPNDLTFNTNLNGLADPV